MSKVIYKSLRSTGPAISRYGDLKVLDRFSLHNKDSDICVKLSSGYYYPSDGQYAKDIREDYPVYLRDEDGKLIYPEPERKPLSAVRLGEVVEITLSTGFYTSPHMVISGVYESEGHRFVDCVRLSDQHRLPVGWYSDRECRVIGRLELQE